MTKSPFRWHTSWSGIVLSEDNLILPNTWDLILDYDIVSDDMLHKDIAMQRLEFMVREKFEASIWTNFGNEWADKFYNQLNTFMITLPIDPYDSLIAAATMLKAQAITKGIFEIHGCSIISKLGYNVENVVAFEESEELLELANNLPTASILKDPWFAREDAGFTDLLVTEDGMTTIIKDTADWADLDLNWDFYSQHENTHVDFSEHKSHKEKWIPLIIKGGANNKGKGKGKDED